MFNAHGWPIEQAAALVNPIDDGVNRRIEPTARPMRSARSDYSRVVGQCLPIEGLNTNGS